MAAMRGVMQNSQGRRHRNLLPPERVFAAVMTTLGNVAGISVKGLFVIGAVSTTLVMTAATRSVPLGASANT